LADAFAVICTQDSIAVPSGFQSDPRAQTGDSAESCQVVVIRLLDAGSRPKAALEHYQFDDEGIARDDVLNVCMEIDDELDAATPAVLVAQSITDAAA
jgi:hypothetical protein